MTGGVTLLPAIFVGATAVPESSTVATTSGITQVLQEAPHPPGNRMQDVVLVDEVNATVINPLSGSEHFKIPLARITNTLVQDGFVGCVVSSIEVNTHILVCFKNTTRPEHLAYTLEAGASRASSAKTLVAAQRFFTQVKRRTVESETHTLAQQVTRATGSVKRTKVNLIRGIGGGAFGEVFLAEQLPLHNKVVVKLARADISPKEQSMLVSECQINGEHYTKLRL